MALSTRPLHSKFGKIIESVNLEKVNESNLYPEIRELFEAVKENSNKTHEAADVIYHLMAQGC